jgi:hypothetical protein
MRAARNRKKTKPQNRNIFQPSEANQMISGNDVPAHIKKNTNMPEAQNCVICVQKKYEPVIDFTLARDLDAQTSAPK